MKEDMEKMKKLEKIRLDDCIRKNYMDCKSLNEVRDIFRVRTQLVDGFKGNFKNMYNQDQLDCEGCSGNVDTQAQLMLT